MRRTRYVCMTVLFLLAFIATAYGDENIQALIESPIIVPENTSVQVPLNFTNYMNISASVSVSGNPARFIFPAIFTIEERTFLPRSMILVGSPIGEYNETIGISYTSAVVNSSFNITTRIVSLNISSAINQTNQTDQTTNQTGNQTVNQTINETQTCQENCSIVIDITQPPQNATYVKIRDIQGFVNVTGSFGSYNCTRVLDEIPDTIGEVKNNTLEPFVLLGLTYEITHTLEMRCRASAFLNNSQLIKFKTTLTGNITGNITNITDQAGIITEIRGLTQEQVQSIVQNVLDSEAKKLQEELTLRENLQDYSCLYSEKRVEEMHGKYLQLSDFAKECLPAFIDANFTTYQFFAQQCPFLQGDFQTAAFILNEYDISGFAKKIPYVQQIQYSAVTKSGQTQVFSQPQQLFSYYPYQITNGCIQKFINLEEFKEQKRSEGFSEGAIIIVIIVLSILAYAWYSATGG